MVHKPRILLVEDESGIADTLQYVLATDGFTPVWCSTAEEALRQFAAELPAQWNGEPLRPLALSEVETRFARQFPGTVARLTDGQQVLVLRTVRQPTRMLHPATDC